MAVSQFTAHPLRIAVVTTYPPSGGTLNEYAFHFIRALREKPEVGDVVVLADIVPDRGDEPSEEGPEPGRAPLRIDRCWRFDAPGNAARIVAAARRSKPDVVLFNIGFTSFGGKKIPATLGLLTPALVRAAGLPTVVLLHNIMEAVDLRHAGFTANPLIAALVRAVGNAATRAILATDLVAVTLPRYVETLAAKYRAGNLMLAPHGSFTDPAPPQLDPPPGPWRILTFGKFGTYKRVEPLIEAYRRLLPDSPVPMELVIAGPDSPNAVGYLASIARRYRAVPGLRFTGYVPERAVPDLFREAAVVALPYTGTTGSSGVLHQAGAYGRAVIMPNLGDLAELLAEEGYAGEFFQPDDPVSLAGALARLRDDPERRRELGLRNYQAAHGLPIGEVVDWYLFHFQALVARRRRGRRVAARAALRRTTG